MTATSPSVSGLYVGASGYAYPSWRGEFYPAGARSAELLELYAERLPSVELNSTGYRLPTVSQLAALAARVPEGFRFSVKMSRRITYGGQYGLIPAFCECARALGSRLGPVLVQLQEGHERDDALLERLLESLDPGLRYAVEFRHESWAGVEPVLDKAAIALVGSLEGAAPFRYLRLREPPYDEAALRAWADRLRPVLAAGVEVYAYFKHEDEPTAPAYARRLEELLASGTMTR
jgi:uncharacterized protein YecE (DUF72 family)